ncbi:ATP-binding protein [Desulfoluna spongiiphila]|uniref:histidine kinase n=1 Tax=Desulfoluna spongiiphila TaxID=419481 RepID=A0A1G5E7D2_9BACT|nr:ATP-binding protein [Desulfoluna spongiiphila]SCY22825.1 PAS domain S-box-containing protein [Desulfoluna spongiiphila]
MYPDKRDGTIRAIEEKKRNLMLVSRDLRVIATNFRPGLRRMGRQCLGRTCHELLYRRGLPCSPCLAVEVFRTGMRAVRKVEAVDGKPLPEACHYAYPLYSGDEVAYVVLLDYDVSSFEEMEESLVRSNAFLKNLINSAVDGVIAADIQGRILIFNDAASDICGFSVEEAVGGMDIRKVYPPGVAEEIMKKMRGAPHGGPGKVKALRVDGMNKSGERVPINLDAAIVYEEGREVASIGFFRDMREVLRMEAELKGTQLQLLQAEKMASLGKLAAGVAHQINNPLGGILLFARLLLEEYELPEEAQQDVKRILRDAGRCRDTVRELLEFARQTQREMSPLDINRAISRTLYLLESQTIFQNIEIRQELDASLPQVVADGQQMNHLFMNIILNAADAMDNEGVLTVKSGVASKGRVFAEVSDTGSGIPEALLKRIFEPFFTTKAAGEGTGLGLSLAYGIVESHGGTITASNNEGAGATFRVEIPCSRSQGEP